jgi:hypothetical protein
MQEEETSLKIMPCRLLIRSSLQGHLTSLHLWILVVFILECLSYRASAFGGDKTNAIILPFPSSDSSLVGRPISNASQLECLEVVPPVIVPPAAARPCSQTLMQYSFQNSYGKPFVGKQI